MFYDRLRRPVPLDLELVLVLAVSPPPHLTSYDRFVSSVWRTCSLDREG
jgi:hypothetical protein